VSHVAAGTAQLGSQVEQADGAQQLGAAGAHVSQVLHGAAQLGAAGAQQVGSAWQVWQGTAQLGSVAQVSQGAAQLGSTTQSHGAAQLGSE